LPVYEYRCSACGHTYEQREGFDAPNENVCPHCGALARRLLRPPAIIFKGPGFYTTDSRSKGLSGDGHRHEEEKAESATSSREEES